MHAFLTNKICPWMFYFMIHALFKINKTTVKPCIYIRTKIFQVSLNRFLCKCCLPGNWAKQVLKLNRFLFS